jgi:hypothetical protein
VAGRDITEGRAARSIAVDLGIGTGLIWQNTGVQYDCAIAGVPFITAVTDARPYERATAPFRKQQFDNQRDPGEQSLSSWWLRSQSSFHGGEGINYYDPLANPYSNTLATNSYRIKKAYGVNIWEPGQVTLLRDTVQSHETTTTVNGPTFTNVNARGRVRQRMIAATWIKSSVEYQGFILHDGLDVDRIDSNGNLENWIDYTAGSADPIFSMTSDGSNVYWVTNDIIGGKLDLRKKALSDATTGNGSSMFTKPGVTVTNSDIALVKQRLVLAANNAIYEFPTNAATLPTATYTHPSTSYTFTSITESGTAIYVAGYENNHSSIFKFTLDTTNGAMPTLTSAITAAELPVGEVAHKIFVYLGYMMIGTSKGVRVASIGSDGSLTYGPILFQTTHPVYDFCARDRFVWCASGVQINTYEPGLVRIDLGTEIDTLQFAYANDLHYDSASETTTTSCCVVGNTDRIAFCTAAPSTSSVGYTYIESASVLETDGYVETGYIRYNTLEPKNFKRIAAQGTFTKGSMSLQTVDLNGTVYDVNSFDAVIGHPESTITQPAGAQDALGLRFRLYRDATDNTLGPTFKGYQLKAVPATPRNRVISIPLLCYDVDTDKYNATTGYEGYAFSKLAQLEAAEASGDVVTWQDFRTGEIQQCLIEEVKFTNLTPPDKRLTNFGGIITLTIRTV